MDSNVNINQRIASTFVEREANMERKGKARDRAALEFVIGAAAALDGEEQQKVLLLATMVSVRGYAQLASMVPA
jgi:hypothetical protein